MATYFFEDTISGLIKIGHSRSVSDRIEKIESELKTHPLRMLGVNRNTYLEKQLHRRFAASARGHEWFAPTEELFRFILNHGITELPTPEMRAQVAKYIEYRMADLGSPHRELLSIIARLYKEVDDAKAERQKGLTLPEIVQVVANAKIGTVVEDSADYLKLKQSFKELNEIHLGMTRERDRLLKANDYLTQRNMRLNEELNQLKPVMQQSA